MMPLTVQTLRLPLRRLRQRVHADDVGGVEHLVERAQCGDRAAFGELFDRFHPVVYRSLYARVGSPEDAEDLVAETFLAAWRALPRFEWTGAPFAAWLLAIAHARVASHYRSVSARPQHAVAGEEQLASLGCGRDDHAYAEQRLEAMRLLDSLPHLPRTVLALRFYGGLSAEEIGATIGKSAGAVRQIQLKALERLSMQMRREQAA